MFWIAVTIIKQNFLPYSNVMQSFEVNFRLFHWISNTWLYILELFRMVYQSTISMLLFRSINAQILSICFEVKQIPSISVSLHIFMSKTFLFGNQFAIKVANFLINCKCFCCLNSLTFFIHEYFQPHRPGKSETNFKHQQQEIQLTSTG